ncbi:bifunctional protein-serine/threonine kinase/phosphatase [Methylovulum psychrotolerans]|uniref:bifunctional protein-serine/threonine kinase/phosphatase n=1 Tax=Methylovulum psychrotolerans TaxID=1704499 RepID=UPI001BFF7005|nr:bifunctional protein-serine/threonine kinase/phosphatase [Methylovulum psychrotolerans]MBT9098322.1 bifunctional protein-serine/threonine kinase/phosphatase [Methylovulum psychrotolerans]
MTLAVRPELAIDIGSASDKGVKADNEDCCGAFIPTDRQLSYKGIAIAIADGMSGSEAGKQASHCCVVGFLSDYYSTPDSWSVKQAGQKILSATNSWLYSQGQVRYQSAKGMVSTLSILVLKSTTAHIFHIGDSRIYRWRNGNLEQITRDHRVWLANDKSYLNRAMGIEPRLEVDYKAMPLVIGDVFLLTTDGVHDFLDAKALKKQLQDGGDLAVLAEAMVRQALANGSDDNLTCQLVRIVALPEAKEDEILRRHANLPFPPPLAVGAVLDGYRIEAELHASKRTQIYRALDMRSGVQVILKTPSVLYDDDTLYIEHFLHEEWAGKRLRHDHVLQVLGTDRVKSCIYYVTEYLSGLTLRQWLAVHPKPDLDTVSVIVGQIAKGLRAFHRMEMLHQDLKPENIMFTADGTVKIIDFGSVKIAGIAELAPLADQEENILGTLNYTAPEYHLGQRGSTRSDLFSLAVITYEMLNGALPYGPMPSQPDKHSLAKLVYVPSFHHNDRVPVWVDGALKKATALNPQLRYGDLSEFLYDLGHPNPAFLNTPQHQPLMERNPLLFWQGLSLLLLLVNFILLYFVSR